MSRNHSSGLVGEIADDYVNPNCLRSADVNVAVAHPVDDSIDACDGLDMDVHKEVQMHPVDFKVKYFNSIALFYMIMLEGKYLVPVSTIGKIVEDLAVSHELEYEFLKNSL